MVSNLEILKIVYIHALAIKKETPDCDRNAGTPRYTQQQRIEKEDYDAFT